MAPGCAAISRIGCVKADSRVRGAFALGPGALPQKAAIAIRSEITAEWRQFLAAILAMCTYVHEESENYDTGTQEHQEERKLGHNVFLSIQ
jgi:hypothetical protein